MTTITSPAKGYTGRTSFGPLVVDFEDGKATVDNLPDGIRDYLLGAGYKVGSKQGQAVITLDGNLVGEQSVDARDYAVPQVVGTPLRDAAVDPEPEDFLPPVNAGEADPHGPEVVSPGIHAIEGPGPIVPGPVGRFEKDKDGHQVVVSDIDEQQRREATAAEEVFVEQREVGEVTAELGAEVGQLATETPAEDLKGKALDDALDAVGLTKSGTADEKRARLAEHQGQA